MKTLAAPLCLLVACAGGTTPRDTGSDTDTNPGIGDTSTTGTQDTDTVITQPQALAVTLSDPSGSPLSGWTVKFCNHVGCRTETTDAAGAVGYVNVTLDPYSLEPVPPESSGYATMNLPYTFDPNEHKDVALVAEVLDPTTPLGATPVDFEMGADLFVTLGEADLAPPDAFHPPATVAGGVRVPDGEWPPIDDITGTVLAIWYTTPFDYDVPAGAPVRIADDLGLGEGATVDLYVGSYSDFAWVPAGSLTVTAGQLVGAARLPLLSTVLAVQP